MKKLTILMLLLIPMVCFAEVNKPMGGAPPTSTDASKITFKGATTINGSAVKENESFTSATSGENAILVTGGKNELNNCTFSKTGESDGEDADFYGTNAAILVNAGTLNINGGQISTEGAHANAVFAYSKGIINITGATINTTSNNSGGVMVTGGGTLTANKCTVKTKGNSSAAIRSDRGGGTLTVNEGTYETSGMGSPAVYSTANILINNAELTSTSSEGLVVEGKNKIIINNTTVTDTNTTLNGNSETYKNVFLYQSMSGDAEAGESVFTAKKSTLITNKGDTIFVTNTTANISLENNTIKNNDGDFLRIQKGKWGTEGSNGGTVSLNMTNQKVKGSIIVDSISSLNMNLDEGSVIVGAIDKDNQAKEINVTLSNDSIISLTGNTYLDKLDNALEDNSNIYSNGKYKLYVNGKEVNINKGSYTLKEDGTIESSEEKTNEKNSNKTLYMYACIAAILLTASILLLVLKKRVIK